MARVFLDRNIAARIEASRPALQSALKISLEQWARRQAGTLGEEPQFARGHRVELLKSALAPLRDKLPVEKFERLAQALSLIFGVEVLIVLKDIWGLGSDDTMEVARWAASALVDARRGERPQI